MEVSEVKRLKKELEAKISLSLSVLVSEFQEASGVKISDLTVEMLEARNLDGTSKSLVSGVNLYLEV